jgi:NDP-sugar pyrophosphorylase family protein
MKVALICPSQRPGVELLAETMPLSNVPLLGESLLEYWLTYLAANSVKEVLVLADDRPEQVQDLVGNGARWGLNVQVNEESRELTAAQALLKYEKELAACSSEAPDPTNPDFVFPEHRIAVMDHFPGLPDLPVFTNYAQCFAAMQAWIPRARTPDRVGLREFSPGVWVGLHTRISPDADLRPPCWIGKNVSLAARTVIGPGTIIEDGSFVEAGATIVNSFVAPNTFVGELAGLTDSIALGSTLVNWKTNSVIKVPDPFLLCYLRAPNLPKNERWFARFSELYSRNKGEMHELWKHLLVNREG